MTILTDIPPRSRKRAKPSFDAPADVTSGGESGWVFRSDAPPDAPAQVGAPAAADETIVMAPVIQSESPLRFAWVPLAIGYTTILAMLPRTRKREGADR